MKTFKNKDINQCQESNGGGEPFSVAQNNTVMTLPAVVTNDRDLNRHVYQANIIRNTIINEPMQALENDENCNSTIGSHCTVRNGSNGPNSYFFTRETVKDGMFDIELSRILTPFNATLQATTSTATLSPTPTIMNQTRIETEELKSAALKSFTNHDQDCEVSSTTSVTSTTTATSIENTPSAATVAVRSTVNVTTLQVTADSTSNNNDIISVNHYKRLIEELICPGCAMPMRAPILTCKTGHCVCEKCTQLLLMCPLCTENFTNIRSRTVEALCSKALFRCANANNGCQVRMPLDLLNWHEKQCIYKTIKCLMGRVWGDCLWTGRGIEWKQHLERCHANKIIRTDSVDLTWNIGVKQKQLNGYYVFEVYEEMFNYYEFYDKDRVLFTMTCTSSERNKKYNFAFEITVIHEDIEALALIQKYPVHSEYDQDILADGTCVNITFTDLARFIDEDKLLHYRVRVLKAKSVQKTASTTRIEQINYHLPDFQQTKFEGVNLKNVPQTQIHTRKITVDVPLKTDISITTNNSIGMKDVCFSSVDAKLIKQIHTAKIAEKVAHVIESQDIDTEIEGDVAGTSSTGKRYWGTPQYNFNRHYWKVTSSTSCSINEQCSCAMDINTKTGSSIKKTKTKIKNKNKKSRNTKNNTNGKSFKSKMATVLRKCFCMGYKKLY